MLDVESWAVAIAQDSAATKESDSDKKETGKSLQRECLIKTNSWNFGLRSVRLNQTLLAGSE